MMARMTTLSLGQQLVVTALAVLPLPAIYLGLVVVDRTALRRFRPIHAPTGRRRRA